MGSSLFVFLVSSLLLFQVSSRAVNISTSWTLPEEGFQHFFRYFQHPVTWDEAKAVCETFQAELITVETDERRDAARAYFKELDVLENVWCGLERVSNQAPFVWTGGGLGPIVGDAYWQEAHPLAPERLCVAIDPLQDYRWRSYPCTGPQQNPFICQLEVPDWATGPEGCLLNSLPSLTVTYLAETEIIELLSDCGLSGTKRIACKGGENHHDLVRRLSCEPLEEGHQGTQGWTTKAAHNFDTSTQSGYTHQMTHSSNTRHKRESGATSPSTIILLQTEASHTLKDTPLVPNEERLSVSDDVQLTGNSAVHQSTIGTPVVRGSTHQLTVKSWLQSHENQLASTISPAQSNTEVTRVAEEVIKVFDPTPVKETTTHNLDNSEKAKGVTSQTAGPHKIVTTQTVVPESTTYSKSKDATTPQAAHPITPDPRFQSIATLTTEEPIVGIATQTDKLITLDPKEGDITTQPTTQDPLVVAHVTPDPRVVTTQATEHSTLDPRVKNLPPTLIQQRMKISPKGKEDDRSEVVNQVLDANSGEPEFIQNKEDFETLVQSKPSFDKISAKDTSNEKKKDRNIKHPTSAGSLPESKFLPHPFAANVSEDVANIEKQLEQIVIAKTTEVISSETRETNPPKLIETVPTLDRPITEATSKASKETFELGLIEKKLTSENKDTVTPKQTTIKMTENMEDLEKQETTGNPSKSHDESIKTESTTPKTEKKVFTDELTNLDSGLHMKILSDQKKSTTSSTLLSSSSSPITSTYWPKIEPPSVSHSTSTDRPNIENVPISTGKPAANIPLKIFTNHITPSTISTPKSGSLPSEIISLSTPSTVGKSAFDEGQKVVPSMPKLDQILPEISISDFKEVIVREPLQETTTISIKKIASTTISLPTLQDKNPIIESRITKQIHPDVEVLSEDSLKPVVSVDATPEGGKYLNEEIGNGDKSTTEVAFSDLSSEEAENPKRTARGRLFPHSNPLSFYPYFLNRVLG